MNKLILNQEEKRAQERRRNLLYIVAAFLCEQGYTNTTDTLFKEAHLSQDIQVCDNIDLENIILEYSDYYYTKFNKYPRLCKKVDLSGSSNLISTTGIKTGKCNKVNCKHEDNKNKDETAIMKGKSLQKGINYVSGNDVNLGMTVTSIFPAENVERAVIKPFNEEFVPNHDKIWKPINDLYPSGSELYDIAVMISKVLIELANHYSPTIIFIDEIDWITTKDTDASSSNPEPARRFRAELLARLDGLLTADNINVILLAATNSPWNIDAALLRRLEKRIFVRLPDEDSRAEIMRFYVEKNLHNTPEFQSLLKETDGYSCADLKLLCKEAWMNQLRPILRDLESNNKNVNANDIKHGNVITSVSYINTAIKVIRPTAKHFNTKYLEWEKHFSSIKYSM
ncbi:hypothetical protein KM043_016196 [Ampulex compressa]|nr:hypothetical protein KM043_016196 [Ampulex compressa]